MRNDIRHTMRTTIDIPDTMYRAVRTRTASEGTTLRYVAIALLGDWLERPDWRPRANMAEFTSIEKETTPSRIAFWSAGRKNSNLNVSHDMSEIRESISRGRKARYAELVERRGFV